MGFFSPKWFKVLFCDHNYEYESFVIEHEESVFEKFRCKHCGHIKIKERHI